MADSRRIGSRTPPLVDYLWVLEAPWWVLEGFCRQAGLARDSTVPVIFSLRPDPFADARLTYPSAKCPDPEAWLRVMALLYVYHHPFKLFQATARDGALQSLTQLKPSIDRELNDILGLAAQGKIAELKGYTRMLQMVFERLKKAPIITPEF
jgi:hypothetical protein